MDVRVIWYCKGCTRYVGSTVGVKDSTVECQKCGTTKNRYAFDEAKKGDVS